MSLHEQKNCPRCNTLFECKPGNITHCQCYGITLTAEPREFIDQRYSDCLCRNCLQQIQKMMERTVQPYIL